MKAPPSLRWLVSFVLVLAINLPQPALAQNSSGVYFVETGHNVLYPFDTFFTERGGTERFGFPITEAFTDRQSGYLVQYFQKARLEYHPANPDPYKIQLGLLGDELGKRQPPLAVKDIPSPSDPTCHYFVETGHKACFQFLTYWTANGGLDMFGYPISETTLDAGRIVQFFQRARLEWHPELPEGQRVKAGAIGRAYFDFARLDPALTTPVKKATAGVITSGPVAPSLRASASVKDAVIARGNMQTATVIVTDQLGARLPAAAVTLVVHFPSGDQSFTLMPTDDQGKATVQFPAGKFKPGTIISMEFIVTAFGQDTKTRTSYILWYY